MSGWLALSALVVAVGTLQALLCALLLAALFPLLRTRLEAAAMQGRTRALTFIAALPLVTGGALVAIAISPSLWSKLGVTGDHCLVHIDHALHLCLHHLPSVAPTFTVVAVVAVGAAMATSALWRAGRLTRLGRHEARALLTISTQRDHVHWIESRVPLALTVGLWRPQVFVSTGLEEGLDEIELGAALAHERCHAAERHALVRMLASVSAMFHLPRVRAELASLMDLACERRADEHAAREVADRLRVASALVRTHRLALGSSSALRAEGPHPALAFAACSTDRLDRRVRALVADAAPKHRSWAGIVAVGGSTLVLAGSHELHHAVEHLLALLV